MSPKTIQPRRLPNTWRRARRAGALGAAVALLAAVASACGTSGGAPNPPVVPVAVQLNFSHQSQFAGLYAAADRGTYRAAGLDLRFLEGGRSVDPVAALVEGRAQFTIMGAARLVEARAAGLPLRAVAAVYQVHPLVIMALRSAGVTRPDDLRGRALAVPPASLTQVRSVLAAAGLAPGSYSEVSVEDAVGALERGDVAAISGFAVNELPVLRSRGLDVAVFWPDDYGVHYYGDVIVTTDKLIADRPSVVTSFVGASLDGWRWAVEHAREAAPLAASYMGPRYDAAHELSLLTGSLPLIRTSAADVGAMTSLKWENVVKTLYERGVVSNPPPVADLFTTEFLSRTGVRLT